MFEIDLLEMGVDLLDFFRGKLSLRRLVSLLFSLPEGSRLRRHLEGPTGLWDRSDYLTANVIDGLNSVAYWSQYNIWFKSTPDSRGDAPEFPRPFPRPGDLPPEEEVVEFSSPEQVRAMLANPAAFL